MYPDWVSPAIAGFLVVWLGFLSLLIWQQEKNLKSLFPKSGERDIRKKFAEIIKIIESFKSELSVLDKSITRVEILRFNPYDDTGGDQSFTICLLDNKGSGMVITSLHARSGTRVFGKEIILGKSNKYKLSKEEESIIKKAMGN
ncbi:DUF4446 family protein [Candidatus Daviesbacteria bacterium]|nr:DUF4446 family protein [Candidatus Daviesbacteria bacterium]